MDYINEINKYNPAGKTTYEDVAKRRKLAEEENYIPSSLPETTTPLAPNYMPGEGVYAQPKLPDYELRLASAKYEEPYIAKEISSSYSESLARNRFRGMTPAPPPFSPYGPKVSIRESHQMGYDGVWRTKYPNYIPGINNEDYYAKRQTSWNKFWNGVGKFAMKSALYGAHGTVSLYDKLVNIASEGSFKAALETDLDKKVADWDQQIDMLLPHYYRKETEDYNLGQRMFKDSANFLWNDVLGSGVSFTVGAMISAAATGGLTGISALGNVGARLGGRIGMKMAREALASKGGTIKSLFNDYVRKGISAGRTMGEATKNLTLLATSAGFESSVEANTFMKESESDFKNYYRNIYGRDPNAEELATFRNSNATVGSAIFAANMGIVGLSNWLLFGKYVGVGNKVIPNLERKLNKNLFGLGTEVVKPGESAIKITNPNIGQKIAGNVFNITKRPISEGLWEEGTQGVVQNTAEEYVKSRYDEVAMNGAVDVLDAIADGFEKQYTSKEGWTEIGIGAIIGAMFGAKEGAFGIYEYRNQRIQLENQIKEYNNAVSGLNTAAYNTLKKAMSLGPQLRSEAQVMSGREFDDAMFSKMAVDHKMGMLDDSAENFKKMVELMPIEDLAQESGLSIDEAKRYKGFIIESYEQRLSDFRSAQDFAENLVGEGKPEFEEYVARNAYLGLQAEERMKDAASQIEALSGQPRVADALNTFSRLSNRARERAMEIRKIKSRIEEIEAEIEDLATKPRNVDGVDPQAEAIQKKTRELEELQNNYNNSIRELSTLIGKDFSIDELINKTSDITDSALSSIDAQSVVEAYETLTAFDDYFNVKSRQEKTFTAKDKAMRHLVNQYRSSLVDYRNMNNFLTKMLDKRFMAEENRGFMKLLSDIATEKYKANDTLPDFMESGTTRVYASDEAVDLAQQEGKISEDEAWSIKAFMHALDKVRSDRLKEGPDDISASPRTESVSDEDYEAAMENPLTVPAVRESIVDKLYTGNADLLSPRESEIYNKYKQDFDDYVQSLGDSPSKLIAGAINKLNKVLNPESVYAQNQNLIDMAKSGLEQSDKDELDKAIDGYKDLMNKREKGEDVDEDQLLQYIQTIQDLGQVGNITDLLPYIEQNRLIENGITPTETLADFGTKDHEIESLLNETDESDTTDGANVDSVQNPEVLTVCKIKNDAGGEWYEISGLRADKFVQGIKSITQMQISSETAPNGARRWHISFGTDVATIAESPYHGRWTVDRASAAVLNRYTNVSIQDVRTAYSVVGKRLGTGAVVPYRTGVGFGINESDKIDQDALSKVRKGDKVQLVVDVNDTYNQELISQYNQAVQSGDKAAINRAEKNMTDNMVIKVMKDGVFISVVKSDTGGVQNLSGIRKDAFNKWKKSPLSSVIQVGTRTVAQTLPGRPVLNIQTSESGVGRVQNLPISEKGAKTVRDVGYVLNGKVVLRNGSKFTPFPFSTSIIRDKVGKYSNTKVPVVVIEGKNGLGYLYPVGLRQVESGEGQNWIQTIDMFLDPNNAGEVADLVDQDFIQSLNAYLTKLGLDPAVYQVSMLTPIQGLVKARRAIEERANMPDVERWVSDKSLDMKQILTTEIESGIDFEGEMFVAPKIRIAFGTRPASRSVDSLIEDSDVPFGGAVTEPNIIESDVIDTEPVPDPTAPDLALASPAQPGKRRSRKGFGSILDKIESYVKEKGLPEYHNIYDFVARKIVGGDIRFLRDKRNPKSLKAEAGLDVNGTVGDKISKTNGMTLDQYVSYLRSRPEQVARDYVRNRSDEQIISELKTFLAAIKYVPSKALNYSLRVNGMNTIKEYGTAEEINAMESAINNLQSSILPASESKTGDIASALSESDPDTAIEALEEVVPDVTNEEKQAFLEDIHDALSQTEESEEQNGSALKAIETKITEIENGQDGTGGAVRTKEVGDQKSAEQVPGQTGGTEQAPGDGNVSGSVEGKIDNYRENGDKFSNPDEVLSWLISEISGVADLYEGMEIYGEGDDVNNLMNRMEARYGIRTINHSHTVYAIRKLNKVRGYDVEYGLDSFTYKPYIRISKPKQESRSQVLGQTRGSGQDVRKREVGSESGIQYHRVTTASFSYGGDQAYSGVDADISPIPDNVMKRNGIRLGTSVTDLAKAGYKRAGGNWVYKFYMNTGIYDMYNIETGEAFRAKLHPGVKIQSSSFVRSLSQSRRQIEGVASTWVENWSAQTRALVDGTNNEDSNREINKPC